MILDVHTHAGNFNQLRDGSQAAELRKLLDDMRAGGVDRSVVLPIPTSPDVQEADEHNRLFLKAVLPHDNLIPFCAVDLHDCETARRQVRDAVALGAKGLKLHPIVQHTELSTEPTYAALEEAAKLNIPALIHTGQLLGLAHELAGAKGELGPLDLGNPLPADRIAGAFPNLRIVLAHFGWPWADEALAIMQRRRNIWLDLSGWAPRHIPETVWVQLIKRFPERFLFGTDFPVISTRRWLDEFRQKVTDPSIRAMVSGGNALEVLGEKSR